jgi:hypothetical protein
MTMPLAYYMSKVSDDMVRRAYIARMIDAKGRAARARQMMADDGYERVSDDSPDILADGRAVVRAGGVAWAVRPDIHAARVQAALESERASVPCVMHRVGRLGLRGHSRRAVVRRVAQNGHGVSSVYSWAVRCGGNPDL